MGVHSVIIIIITQFSWITKIFFLFYHYAFSGGRTDQRCITYAWLLDSNLPLPIRFLPVIFHALPCICTAACHHSGHHSGCPAPTSLHHLRQSVVVSASFLVSLTQQWGRLAFSRHFVNGAHLSGGERQVRLGCGCPWVHLWLAPSPCGLSGYNPPPVPRRLAATAPSP